MEFKEHKDFCPVMNLLCPQGEEKAMQCRMRFETDYDPVRNFRDFEIICCSHQRTREIDDSSPIV
ncbi:MAG: hypothetical protein WAN36_10445 [Calditrichia bacterium]